MSSDFKKPKHYQDEVACNNYSSFDDKQTRKNKNRIKHKYAMNVPRKKKQATDSCVQIIQQKGQERHVCLLCDVTTYKAKNMKEHLNGKKHRNNAAKATNKIHYTQTVNQIQHSPNHNQSNNNINNAKSTRKRSFHDLYDDGYLESNAGNMKKKRKLNNDRIVTDKTSIKKQIEPKPMCEKSMTMPALEYVNNKCQNDNDSNDICIASEIKHSNIGALTKFCPKCKTRLNTTQKEVDDHDKYIRIDKEWTYWCWDCGDVEV